MEGSDDAPQPAGASVRWTVLTYATGKVITLGATVVLARLLTPSDFGVVMEAFVVINVVGLFGDLGLGATIVARQDLDRRGLGTALSLVLASGLVLGVLIAGLAPVLSTVLDEPRLRGVLLAMAPMTLIGSFTWFYQWLLQRDLMFRERFFGFLAQTAVYAATAIGAAILGAGVWSIVAGHLAGQVAMALVFIGVARLVRPRFDRAVARSVLWASRGFLLQNTAMLLQQNADYVAVGRTLGAAQLGYYSMAYRLSELPYLAVADPVTKVTFAAFSRKRAEGQDVRTGYLTTLRLVTLVTWPMGSVLSAVAEPFTRLVYGPKWAPMVGALAVLALWGAVKSAQATVEWFLNSVGGASAAGVVAITILVLQAPALFVAADEGGIAAVSWVLLAGVGVSMAVLVALLRTRAGVDVGAHLRVLWPVAIACAGAWIAARLTATALERVPAVVACAASVGLGLAAYLSVISVVAPGSVGMVYRAARRAMGRASVSATGQ